MTEYANGDTGSDRAYEYEQEIADIARDEYLEFCESNGYDPDSEQGEQAYEAWLENLNSWADSYWQDQQDDYSRIAEEEMLGRPLFPNEY